MLRNVTRFGARLLGDRQLRKLHRDERGVEGIELILIVAAIVIPLLGLLWWFATDIKDWILSIWEEARGEVDDGSDDFWEGN